MFDIGFFELLLLGVVGLLVLGPERLPVVARTIGLWIGKIKGMITSVQTDIEREIQNHEVMLREAELTKELEEMKAKVEEEASNTQTASHELKQETEANLSPGVKEDTK